ncbi:glycosyltransferase [Winogradskyella poriferorum]|uniref:glycosyltransferase n=1 Tax=Winogradskyella poriferorum TaxID=307627 RepID=UPI003D65EA08
MTRVVQLIDSLDAGGAERLAVTYANLISEKIEASFLCTTRREGSLKSSVKDAVGYLFLERKSSFDLRAIFRFRKFLKENRIRIIHAHATSYFFATLVKFITPSVKVVWHDHYGKSEELDQRPKFVLKLCSLFFNQIFSVNHKLLDWSKKQLYCKKVDYLQNIVVLDENEPQTALKGSNNKRILCLANLRTQKDHLNLLKAFQLVLKSHSDWTLHCVGKDFKDEYSRAIKQYVIDHKMEESVYFYGSRQDINHIMSQCEIGVLSSKSEGLPLALLEYGLAGLAVVTTDVGDSSLVIIQNKNGLSVEPNNPIKLSIALSKLIDDKLLRKKFSMELMVKVKSEYSADEVLYKLLKVYRS